MHDDPMNDPPPWILFGESRTRAGLDGEAGGGFLGCFIGMVVFSCGAVLLVLAFAFPPILLLYLVVVVGWLVFVNSGSRGPREDRSLRRTRRIVRFRSSSDAAIEPEVRIPIESDPSADDQNLLEQLQIELDTKRGRLAEIRTEMDRVTATSSLAQLRDEKEKLDQRIWEIWIEEREIRRRYQ